MRPNNLFRFPVMTENDGLNLPKFDPSAINVTLFKSVCPPKTEGKSKEERCDETRSDEIMQRDIALTEFVRLGARYIPSLKKIRAEKNSVKRNFLKRKLLPAASISATLKTRKSGVKLEDKVKQYTGLIVMDFDHLEDIEEARRKLCQLPYVWYVSLSSSAQGLYAIALTENMDYKRHELYFDALVDEAKAIGLKMDEPCRDVTRLRFVSYDDNPYINENCTPYHLPEDYVPKHGGDLKLPPAGDDGEAAETAADGDDDPELHAPEELDLNEHHMRKLPYRDARERALVFAQEWVRKQIPIDDFRDWYVMASALGTLGEDGWKILDMISKFSSKYDRVQNRDIFERLQRTNREITMGSFFYKCHEYGVMTDAVTHRESPEFPVDAFPDRIQEIILKAHEGMNHPIDYIGSSLIAVAGAAVGNSIRVQLMADWVEKPIIYMALVGEAGTNKSAPLAFAVKPLEMIDDEEMEAYNEKYEEYRDECDKALRSRSGMPDEPEYYQYVLNDFTIEAMMQQHAINQRGMLVYKDELLNFIRNMSRYSTGNDEMTWTTMFTGGSIQNTRKDKRKTKLKTTCVSIIGTIQPESLPEFAKGKMENGFIDRWLFAYPEKVKAPRFKTGRQMPEIVQMWNDVIERILSIEYDPEAKPLTLSEEAETVYANWFDALAEKKFSGDVTFRRASTKMERYLVRLAIVLEALKFGAGGEPVTEISAWAVKGAIDLVYYYLSCGMKARKKFKTGPLEALTDLQRMIYMDIPVRFETKEGIEIAGQHGMSERTFRYWLHSDFFIKCSHGNYERRYR